MHLDEIQRDNQSKGWKRKPGHKYMVIDLGGKCTSFLLSFFDQKKTKRKQEYIADIH